MSVCLRANVWIDDRLVSHPGCVPALSPGFPPP